MSVIGVYDSGIGGLTTLSALKSVVCGHDFLYLADTMNMPFGTKSREEIYASVTRGLKILRDNSDVQVIACNTASTVVSPKNAHLLQPQIDGLNPSSTLFLSTPATMKALEIKKKNFVTADTKNLATMVEIMGSLSYKSRDKLRIEYLDETVKNLLKSATKNLDEIDTIVIGCSHYVYVKPLLKTYLPKAKILDRNCTLKYEVLKGLTLGDSSGKTTFRFTLGNENEKYAWVLEQLDQNRCIFDV